MTDILLFPSSAGKAMPEILDLIKAAQQGNERAMETLIRQFEPLIINESCLFEKLDEDCRRI